MASRHIRPVRFTETGEVALRLLYLLLTGSIPSQSLSRSAGRRALSKGVGQGCSGDAACLRHHKDAAGRVAPSNRAAKRRARIAGDRNEPLVRATVRRDRMVIAMVVGRRTIVQARRDARILGDGCRVDHPEELGTGRDRPGAARRPIGRGRVGARPCQRVGAGGRAEVHHVGAGLVQQRGEDGACGAAGRSVVNDSRRKPMCRLVRSAVAAEQHLRRRANRHALRSGTARQGDGVGCRHGERDRIDHTYPAGG